MTKAEYESELKTLNREHEDSKNKLIKEYALSNNPYKIGDIITDHYQRIKIEKIRAISYFSEIGCRYYGVNLKEDGTPVKSGSKTWIYQSNIKSKELI